MKPTPCLPGVRARRNEPRNEACARERGRMSNRPSGASAQGQAEYTKRSRPVFGCRDRVSIHGG